jgi:nanoRNase/pAp phosphatase (c-di-AMP/oligoRNAs hydrolase)
LYDAAAFCLLPRAEGPEVVGEVADLLIRCEGVTRVFCAAAFESNVLVSLRTQPASGDAGALARRVLDGLGRGGGHEYRAGGKISNICNGRISEVLEDDLRQRWLAACHVDRARGTRLVPRREIVGHL